MKPIIAIISILHFATSQYCSNVGPGFPTGILQYPDLKEASGLAASRASNTTQILYSHNDSGEVRARLYVMDQFGTPLNKIEIEGYVMRDFEDMTIGPGGAIPGQDYIYLGDIGNNPYIRPAFEILRFPEPSVEQLT